VDGWPQLAFLSLGQSLLSREAGEECQCGIRCLVEGEMLLLQVANRFSQTARVKCRNLPNTDSEKMVINKNPAYLHVYQTEDSRP